MFELGWAEVGLISLIALLVLGPTEFVEIARKAGRLVGSLRQHAAHWQSQLESALPQDKRAKDKNDGGK
ncbi:MAG: twin-arginine translocase TatA/TatE family subunit [Bdellovibrionales bacterium]